LHKHPPHPRNAQIATNQTRIFPTQDVRPMTDGLPSDLIDPSTKRKCDAYDAAIMPKPIQMVYCSKDYTTETVASEANVTAKVDRKTLLLL